MPGGGMPGRICKSKADAAVSSRTPDSSHLPSALSRHCISTLGAMPHDRGSLYHRTCCKPQCDQGASACLYAMQASQGMNRT